jgi:hypothetical protein
MIHWFTAEGLIRFIVIAADWLQKIIESLEFIVVVDVTIRLVATVPAATETRKSRISCGLIDPGG